MGLLNNKDNVDCSLYVGYQLGSELSVVNIENGTVYVQGNAYSCCIRENEELYYIRKLRRFVNFDVVDFGDNPIDIIAASHIGTDFEGLVFRTTSSCTFKLKSSISCLVRNIGFECHRFKIEKYRNNTIRLKNINVTADTYLIPQQLNLNELIFLDAGFKISKLMISKNVSTNLIDNIVENIQVNNKIDCKLIDNHFGYFNDVSSVMCRISNNYGVLIYDTNRISTPEKATSGPEIIPGTQYARCDVQHNWYD